MWKNPLDIFPGELVGVEEYEIESDIELLIGDSAKVIVDSQFCDYYIDTKEPIERCVGRTGTVIDFDSGDEWAYQLEFENGEKNWFKRYHLKRIGEDKN